MDFGLVLRRPIETARVAGQLALGQFDLSGKDDADKILVRTKGV